MRDHLDGKPFRKIARWCTQSKSTVLRQYQRALQEIPDNNALTKKYCDRFCGIIVVDGKYIAVKGYEKKIPLLWGLDYLTHDVPMFLMAPSESYESWLKYFGYLKSIRYPLKIVICDDNINIQMAAEYMFPNVIIQICHNHYLENIRKALQVRTEVTYQQFVFDLKRELFTGKRTREDFQGRAFGLYKKYTDNTVAVTYLLKIQKDFAVLTGAALVPGAPTTTNIIESYNSHLQARLKSIKGFQSFTSAKKWINAYIVQRRFRPFTDCTKKFRMLNGKTSISKTLRKGAVLPLLTI